MSSDVPESSRARRADESDFDHEEGDKAGPEALARRRPWVILVSIPDILDDKDGKAQMILPGTDVLLGFEDPPRPTYLFLPKRIAPDPKLWSLFPYIIATCPSSGRLLFHATQGRGMLDTDYFLCDAHTRTAARLPPVPEGLLKFFPRRSIGLIADPRRAGHYMVAQLRPTSSTSHESLLYYSTDTGEWAVKTLATSPVHHPWGAHGVFSHDGMLWWVDIAYGLLACDPFPDHPDLRFIPLPLGSEIDGPAVKRYYLDSRRCVRPSEGKLRFVEIRALPHDPVADISTLPDNAVVWMWTLVDPVGPHHWKLEYEARFADIWAHESYIAAGLPPQKVPALALVHPGNHEVVYFFHGTSLFGVDMRAGRVVACAECLVSFHPQLLYQTSRFVDAWELPPTLLAIDPSAAAIKGPDDEELSMTEMVMGSDEELAYLMSQMELKSQPGEEHSLEELMSRLKDVASEGSGSASRPPSPPDQADEP